MPPPPFEPSHLSSSSAALRSRAISAAPFAAPEHVPALVALLSDYNAPSRLLLARALARRARHAPVDAAIAALVACGDGEAAVALLSYASSPVAVAGVRDGLLSALELTPLQLDRAWSGLARRHPVAIIAALSSEQPPPENAIVLAARLAPAAMLEALVCVINSPLGVVPATRAPPAYFHAALAAAMRGVPAILLARVLLASAARPAAIGRWGDSDPPPIGTIALPTWGEHSAARLARSTDGLTLLQRGWLRWESSWLRRVPVSTRVALWEAFPPHARSATTGRCANPCSEGDPPCRHAEPNYLRLLPAALRELGVARAVEGVDDTLDDMGRAAYAAVTGDGTVADRCIAASLRSKEASERCSAAAYSIIGAFAYSPSRVPSAIMALAARAREQDPARRKLLQQIAYALSTHRGRRGLSREHLPALEAAVISLLAGADTSFSTISNGACVMTALLPFDTEWASAALRRFIAMYHAHGIELPFDFADEQSLCAQGRAVAEAMWSILLWARKEKSLREAEAAAADVGDAPILPAPHVATFAHFVSAAMMFLNEGRKLAALIPHHIHDVLVSVITSNGADEPITTPQGPVPVPLSVAAQVYERVKMVSPALITPLLPCLLSGSLAQWRLWVWPDLAALVHTSAPHLLTAELVSMKRAALRLPPAAEGLMDAPHVDPWVNLRGSYADERWVTGNRRSILLPGVSRKGGSAYARWPADAQVVYAEAVLCEGIRAATRGETHSIAGTLRIAVSLPRAGRVVSDAVCALANGVAASTVAEGLGVANEEGGGDEDEEGEEDKEEDKEEGEKEDKDGDVEEAEEEEEEGDEGTEEKEADGEEGVDSNAADSPDGSVAVEGGANSPSLLVSETIRAVALAAAARLDGGEGIPIILRAMQDRTAVRAAAACLQTALCGRLLDLGGAFSQLLTAPMSACGVSARLEVLRRLETLPCRSFEVAVVAAASLPTSLPSHDGESGDEATERKGTEATPTTRISVLHPDVRVGLMPPLWRIAVCSSTPALQETAWGLLAIAAADSVTVDGLLGWLGTSLLGLPPVLRLERAVMARYASVILTPILAGSLAASVSPTGGGGAVFTRCVTRVGGGPPLWDPRDDAAGGLAHILTRGALRGEGSHTICIASAVALAKGFAISSAGADATSLAALCGNLLGLSRHSVAIDVHGRARATLRAIVATLVSSSSSATAAATAVSEVLCADASTVSLRVQLALACAVTPEAAVAALCAVRHSEWHSESVAAANAAVAASPFRGAHLGAALDAAAADAAAPLAAILRRLSLAALCKQAGADGALGWSQQQRAALEAFAGDTDEGIRCAAAWALPPVVE